MATTKKRKKSATTKKHVVHRRRTPMTVSTHKRRRKIGASPSETLVYGILGGIAAKVVNKNIGAIGLPTSITPFIVPAVGAGLSFMMKDEKLKNIGKGMLIVGAADLVNGYIPAIIKGTPQTVGINYNRNIHSANHNKRVGYSNNRTPQTVGRQRTLRLNGVNPTNGNAGNRGTNLPMTIGNLYGSF